MTKQPLTAYPILRLSIPLAAGIFFMESCSFPIPYWGWAGMMLATCIALGICIRGRNFRYRWWFGVGTFLLFFLIGAFRMQCRWQHVHVDWPDESRTYRGVVMEPPIEKPKSIQCKMALYDRQNIVLYLAKDSFAQTVEMGDPLVFHAQVKAPSNEGVAFDYASYLLHKGISGTAYVPAGYSKKGNGPKEWTIKRKALAIRERIVELYRSWGVGEKQLPVLSALTVGYKADLSEEVREAYSVAGISHVLALSGMHIGFLWLLLSVLLKPLEKGKVLRIVRWLLSVGLLWAFAFIAGLEASVVRAVIMCMLMELGKLSGSKPLSLNTLAVAAFFMLLYNPSCLYDVGFQLSFLAVLAILIFYDPLNSLCPFRIRALRGVWSVMSVSMAAQIGTAPLVMYYFSNFSVYFLLANLGVAWLVPCIIYTAFASMLLGVLPEVRQWIVWMLDKMVMALNELAEWVSGLPYASLSSIKLHQMEVWGLYVLLGGIVWYVKVRSRKAFIVLLAMVALWLGGHCVLLVF